MAIKQILLGYSVLPNLEEIKMSFEECLRRYQGQKISNDFYIFGERSYHEKSEAMLMDPALYHLFDFNADKNFRGLHLTISTAPYLRRGMSSKAIEIKLNGTYGVSMVDKIIHQDPEKIADSIKLIERTLVPSSKHESPLFSNRTTSDFYRYALIFELDRVINK